MADKLRTLQNLEALQARYVGTGHADTTKYEWTSNILRDSYASYIGHPPLLEYMAIGMGENKEKVRAMMIEKMVRGAGNPPENNIILAAAAVRWRRPDTWPPYLGIFANALLLLNGILFAFMRHPIFGLISDFDITMHRPRMLALETLGTILDFMGTVHQPLEYLSVHLVARGRAARQGSGYVHLFSLGMTRLLNGWRGGYVRFSDLCREELKELEELEELL
ncbi:hypothetical protein RJZ56_007051 [Blastomyces dermatitidis]